MTAPYVKDIAQRNGLSAKMNSAIFQTDTLTKMYPLLYLDFQINII